MMHHGHVNAFRLARSLGTKLLVGLNSDLSIAECKGPPIMRDQERLTMVSSCKFVDAVIPGCPYVVREAQFAFLVTLPTSPV
jgi:ethanolamine-phosphate cytidylyltransferase